MLIQRPTENELWSVVQALLSNLDENQRRSHLDSLKGYCFADVVSDQHDVLSGLFVARQANNGEILGAIWSHRLPGQSIVVGPPTLLHTTSDDRLQMRAADHDPPNENSPDHVSPEDFSAGHSEQVSSDEIFTALLEHTCNWISQTPGTMAQVVLEVPPSNHHQESADDSLSLWTRYGFAPLVELVYVIKHFDSADSIRIANRQPTGFTTQIAVVDWNSQPDRWCKILEQTYVDTLDCPQLNGRRKNIDTLRGYQATATFLPDGWRIATSSDAGGPETDVGCLVLADHPENDLIELVYFGVAQQFRGNGVGAQLFQEIFDFVLRENRSSLLAAVDSNNLPALKLYQKYGFAAVARRNVLARFF